MNCEVLAVSSIKGGVGKTTTVANLGSVLARRGKRVLVIDGNLSVPNLGIHFGYIDVGKTVHDVLARKSEVGEAVYEHSERLHVMPGLVSGGFVSRWSFVRIIEELRDDYDYILIDTSPSFAELSKAIEVSDAIVFVATPDYPTISSTLQLIEKVRGKIVIKGIILNMVKGKNFELSAREIADVGRLSVLGSVPYNVRVQKAVANFSPLCLESKWNGVYWAYAGMLNDLFG
ncbi:AAA family ATPase [Candidatus Pacearchaeota archaeon]|nr:AAA family ATPase [Candidatus Pacearchaeota archaeon]